jgi:hypothetical protein
MTRVRELLAEWEQGGVSDWIVQRLREAIEQDECNAIADLEESDARTSEECK